MGRPMPPMGVHPFLGAWGSPAADQKGLYHKSYTIKRSRGVLVEMHCNERIRMQQATTSGAVTLCSYGHVCGLWGVPGGSLEGAPDDPIGP